MLRRVMCRIGWHRFQFDEEILCYHYGHCKYCKLNLVKLAPWLADLMEGDRNY
jgi:hypothetical protein